MPTPRKTTAKTEPTPKRAPAKRAPRKAATPRKAAAAETPIPIGKAPTSIAAKRSQMRGEDAQGVDPYAPTAWGAEEAQGSLVDLELPSGQIVLAQRPGPEGLMAAGMLDDLDMLGSVLPKIMGGKNTKAGQNFDASHVMKNPQMLRQAMKLMDRVVVHVVIKPELTPEPEDPRDKERGKIYPSSVGMEDKTFIFNWAVGGTRDLATFRQRYEESVADLESGEDVAQASE